MKKSYKHIHLLLWLFLFTSFGCTSPENENSKEASKSVVVDTTANSNQQPEVSNEAAEDTKIIVFFGNSLTAGYGLDPSEAFPALIQDRIDSLDLNYEVVNAGLSGETTASGRNRVEWVLKQEVDVFVLELGANDGLRGINLDETKKNLQAIIDIVRKTNPDTKIVLTGMQIPPSMGADYAGKFRQIFPELAKENDIYLIPFLLEDVGGERELNLPDVIHPNVEGHKILADNVWKVLKDVL